MRTLGDRVAIGPRQAAARLGALEVFVAAESAREESAWPFGEHLVELAAGEPERPVLPRARRDRPRELVDERLAPAAEPLAGTPCSSPPTSTAKPSRADRKTPASLSALSSSSTSPRCLANRYAMLPS
jgi:hypothetical protein